MADEDEQIEPSADRSRDPSRDGEASPRRESEIETAEDYRDYHQAEGTPVTRYGEYHDGKAELAALVVEGEVESTVSASAVANERYEESDPQTTERATAKGMVDAVGELADLGALDEADEGNDEDPSEDNEDGGEVDPDDEDVDNTDDVPDVEGGGVTVDMDDV